MSYKLTVGPIPRKNNRMLAIITEGGHPQIASSGDCTVCTMAWLDELPDENAEAWFLKMVQERPWETRQ